jgi:hypothetical protein
MTYTIEQSVNMALDHLIAQKRQAGGGGSCFYRTSSGLKCAIGALILDEEYDDSFEGQRVDSAEVLQALIRSGHKELAEEVAVANALQALHDEPCNCEFTQLYNRTFADQQKLGTALKLMQESFEPRSYDD